MSAYQDLHALRTPKPTFNYISSAPINSQQRPQLRQGSALFMNKYIKRDKNKQQEETQQHTQSHINRKANNSNCPQQPQYINQSVFQNNTLKMPIYTISMRVPPPQSTVNQNTINAPTSKININVCNSANSYSVNSYSVNSSSNTLSSIRNALHSQSYTSSKVNQSQSHSSSFKVNETHSFAGNIPFQYPTGMESHSTAHSSHSSSKPSSSEGIVRETPARNVISPPPALYRAFDHALSLKNYLPLFIIGKGGFGKVWKVQCKKTSKFYAMKEMIKHKIITKKSVSSVLNQRELLSVLNNPFIINMKAAFQDRQHLFLIMDYLDGGDLRYHMNLRGFFSEKESKFLIACLLLGLQHMHSRNIIHRDLKPQNLVLQGNGYLRITDFGVSRILRQNNANDTSGTPGYMAPQVMCRRDHSFTVDFFAIGVIAYELMLGRRPYTGLNRKEVKEHMLMKQAAVKLQELPDGWSPDAMDFINKLLLRNPAIRLGSTLPCIQTNLSARNIHAVRVNPRKSTHPPGINELMEHPWLSSIDFAQLSRKKITAPYQPPSITTTYHTYKHNISQDTIDDQNYQNQLIIREESVQQLFQGYQWQKDKSLIQQSNPQ